MTLAVQVSPPRVGLTEELPTGVAGADVVAVPVVAQGEGLSLGPGAAELQERLGVDLVGLLERRDARAAAGEVVEHLVLDDAGQPGLRLVLLVGVGAGRPEDLRRAGAALARRVKGCQRLACSVPAVAGDAGTSAFVTGIVLGSFGFHRRSGGPVERPVEEVVLAGAPATPERQRVLDRAVAIAGAGWRARTFALVPSNEKNPAWLADRAREIGQQNGLKVRVWDEHELAKEGFGGIVGVGQASSSPPRLIRLDYTPRKSRRRARHLVLVGKGITFDTGGLSLKPADAMASMKRDMTGGGVVISVMAALADIDCPLRVTGLVPAAENAVSGAAMRPGDVLRHYGGRTSEVTNTDAEGRLVLADALAYAVAQLKPDVLVDVATLTGAMKVALGQRTGGFFATDDALASHLTAAGEAAGEPLWRMPLVEDYEERLRSKVADADNAADGPGAITAALFLRHFTGGLPWAHLDVASAGDSPVDAYEWTQGATGFGARALLHWLGAESPLDGVVR